MMKHRMLGYISTLGKFFVADPALLVLSFGAPTPISLCRQLVYRSRMGREKMPD